MQNLTSLPAAEWSSFRSLLQDELRKAGFQITGVAAAATPPDSRVRVTLSEDARGLLFVAEVFSGDNRQIAMLPWNLPVLGASQTAHHYYQERSLDAAGTNPRHPAGRLRIPDAGFEPEQNRELSFAGGQVDAIGYSVTACCPGLCLATRAGGSKPPLDGFEAFLPVATCTGAWNPELKLTCANGIANWPGTLGTHWVADRNVVVEGDAARPRFCEGWGSDWASIADPCGAGRHSRNREQPEHRTRLDSRVPDPGSAKPTR